MAATKLTCPECGKVLRPAKPLPAGKRVKCPQCSALFVAQDDDIASAAATGKSATTASEPKAKAKSKKKGSKKDADKKPAKADAKPKSGEDGEDGPATYGYLDEHSTSDEPEIEYAPDSSIRDLRGPAQAAVMKPSNFMIMSGVLGCLCYLIFMVVILIPIMFPVPEQTNEDGSPVAAKPEEKKESSDPDDVKGSLFNIMGWDLMDVPSYAWWNITLLILGCLVGMVICGVVTYGAVRMQMLESRMWGMIAGVMLMMPTSAMGTFAILCIVVTASVGRFFGLSITLYLSPLLVLMAFGLNIGVGLWAILTLNRQEVIDGYDYVEE